MGISQRKLAKRAGLAFRTIQLLESTSNARLSTLESVAVSLGYRSGAVEEAISALYESPPESVVEISRLLSEETWKVALFDFVDAYRRHPDAALVDVPPRCTGRLEALLASVVETLCDEVGQGIPVWAGRVPPLATPWFVSGVENLKASALVESPIHFRKRKVFVLSNFLSRA